MNHLYHYLRLSVSLLLLLPLPLAASTVATKVADATAEAEHYRIPRTYQVFNTGDNPFSPGIGTLRWAIDEAQEWRCGRNFH